MVPFPPLPTFLPPHILQHCRVPLPLYHLDYNVQQDTYTSVLSSKQFLQSALVREECEEWLVDCVCTAQARPTMLCIRLVFNNFAAVTSDIAWFQLLHSYVTWTMPVSHVIACLASYPTSGHHLQLILPQSAALCYYTLLWQFQYSSTFACSYVQILHATQLSYNSRNLSVCADVTFLIRHILMKFILQGQVTSMTVPLGMLSAGGNVCVVKEWCQCSLLRTNKDCRHVYHFRVNLCTDSEAWYSCLSSSIPEQKPFT